MQCAAEATRTERCAHKSARRIASNKAPDQQLIDTGLGVTFQVKNTVVAEPKGKNADLDRFQPVYSLSEDEIWSLKKVRPARTF